MSSRGGPSVPKFASFKKKPEPLEASRIQQRADELKPDDGRHIRNHRSRDRRKEISSDKALVRLSDRPPSADRRQSSSATRLEASHRALPRQHAKDESFVVDRDGDALIRRYGSNDRYKVPAYRRFGAGRLLGSNDFFRIDRIGTREEFFFPGYGGGGPELSRDRKSVLAKTGRKSSDLVRVRLDKSQTFSGNEDFLPLKASRKRKRSHSQSDESQAEEGRAYRSIHGMSKRHENSDSDESYDSDSSPVVNSMETIDPIKLKTIALTARVKDHPDDISAWIELVEHQDVLRDLNCQHGRSATQAEIKSYADIKHSMLEKALKHSKTLEHDTALYLRIMQEGSEIWDLTTTEKRWEELLKNYGTDFEIWKAFMTFKQTNLGSLHYDKVRQLYSSKLQDLKNQLAENSSEPSAASLCEQLVVVFSMTTLFITQAGYAELATASWQAILEIHFHRPISLTHAVPEVVMSSLQNFWESEAPRIGDRDAKGWAAFESAGGTDEPPEPKTFDNGVVPNTRDPYKVWAAFEEHKAHDAKVPARTMDDGTEDDPFRVIMYSDIEEFLFVVPSTSLSFVREQLVEAFLAFCQLPSVCGTSGAITAIARDQLITSGVSSSIADRSRKLQNTDSKVVRSPDFDNRYHLMVKSAEVLFPGQQWFKYVTSLHDLMSPRHYSLVQNTLRQLSLTYRMSDFAPYCLAFESANNPGTSKKIAKSLLKQDSSNVDLYIGFARSEFAKGSNEVARNVLSAALGLVGLTQHDRLRLCITSTWFELEDLRSAQAVVELCRASDEVGADEDASPAQILKIRQFLSGNRDHLLSSRNPDIAVSYAEGIALLEYITRRSGKEPQSATQGDIWSAIASVDSFSESLVSRGQGESAAHEKLLQFAAQLLYHHASHG